MEDEGIQLVDDKVIEDLGIENYKYLGVLEADTIKTELMKEKIMKEYRRRVKKVLGSKLSGGNTIKAINAWAISVVRYSGGIVDWTVDELKEADKKTRKLLTLNGALHPRSNTRQALSPTSRRWQGFDLFRGMHQTGGTWTVRLFERASPRTCQRMSPTSGDRTNSIRI